MIKQSELNYSRYSNVDPFGRVFFYEGSVYRIINKNHEEFCKKLLASELIFELQKNKYIPATSIDTSLEIEGNPLVLHHEKCTIIRSYEWSFEMFKAACILVLQIQQLCDKYGYQLKDAHPDNVTFHHGRAVFFDIGSIVKKTEGEWCAKKEFIETMLLPLVLLAEGNYCMFRLLEEGGSNLYRLSPSQGIFDNEYFRKKLDFTYHYIIRHGQRQFTIRKHNSLRTVRALNAFVRKLRKEKKTDFFKIKTEYQLPNIRELENWQSFQCETEWADYHLNIASSVDNSRFNRIFEIVSERCDDARTMLDLAGNGGGFAYLMHTKHIYDNIIVGDYDENAINKGFLFFRENNIPIDMVWMNCVLPFEAELTTQRLKSDIVFALAITHHLILRQGLHLSVIFKRFKQFTNKYVAVEFMPLGLWGGEDSIIPERPEWYTQEWFKQEFESEFKVIHIEEISKNRVLFLGEKK